MPDLSLRNIEEISLDIMKQEITFSHLADELIDHVCCDVEYEMQNGLDFSTAYKKVKMKIGPRRLKEIQEETLYAVDTKYRNMKNLMKISGVAGTVFLGFGAILKIQHFPGAGMLMTAGALILAFLFLPPSLGVLWKETHNKKSLFLFISAFIAGVFFILGTLFKIQHWPSAGIVLLLAASSFILLFIPALLISKLKEEENKVKRPIYILGAAGVICYIAGLLFKIQHWPLSGTLMVLGVVILGLIVFPWYTWHTWNEDSRVDARFIFMIIGAMLIIVPGALINLNLQNRFENGFLSGLKQQQVMYDYQFNTNVSLMNQYRDSSFFPRIKEMHLKTNDLLKLIGDIQSRMIRDTESKQASLSGDHGSLKENNGDSEIQPSRISNPFQTEPVRDLLFPGTDTRKELDKALSDYLNSISDMTPAEMIQKYRGWLEPSVFLPTETAREREISIISGLHSLELLKNTVLTVESNFLTTVAAN
jgi:hypothetical protein